MKVRWNKQSKEHLRQTARYIRQEFGERAMDEFMQVVQHTNDLLADNPRLGFVEPLLSDLTTQYRSIVVRRLNKIVYCIADNYIKVVAFWDCRREPQSQASQIDYSGKV